MAIFKTKRSQYNENIQAIYALTKQMTLSKKHLKIKTHEQLKRLQSIIETNPNISLEQLENIKSKLKDVNLNSENYSDQKSSRIVFELVQAAKGITEPLYDMQTYKEMMRLEELDSLAFKANKRLTELREIGNSKLVDYQFAKKQQNKDEISSLKSELIQIKDEIDHLETKREDLYDQIRLIKSTTLSKGYQELINLRNTYGEIDVNESLGYENEASKMANETTNKLNDIQTSRSANQRKRTGVDVERIFEKNNESEQVDEFDNLKF